MRQSYGINPNVYNGGAVTFNSAPFVNFMAAQEQKRKAKEEAFDKQLTEQMKSLTPTGMRAQDLPGWSMKFKKLQNLAIEKKKFLQNPTLDNYATANKFNALRTELTADPELSKQIASDFKVIAPLRLEGKLNPTDEDNQILQNMGLSIYDDNGNYNPNRKSYSINDLSVNRPPFDSAKFLADAQAGRKRARVGVGEPQYDDKHGQALFSSVEQYTPEDVKAMADNAPFLMEKNKSAQDAFERILHDTDNLKQLQDVYSKHYPGIVDTPEKAAKAYILQQVTPSTGFSQEWKPYTDKEGDLNRAKELARYKHGLTEDEIRLREDLKNKSVEEQENKLTKHVDTIISNAVKKGVTWETTIKGQKSNLYKIAVTPSFAESLVVQDAAGEKRHPNGIGVDNDGNFYGLYWKYKKNKDGEYVFEKTPSGSYVIDADLTAPIDRTTFQSEYANRLLSPKLVEEEGLNTAPRRAVTGAPATRSAGGSWKTRAIKVQDK